MNNTRLKMLNGEKIGQCERCYVVENETSHGFRKRLNTNFKDSFDVVELTNENGSIDNIKLKLWDIRISNFCNFKCRSCGHELSSSWYGDSIKMGRNLEGVKPVISIDDKSNFMDTLLPHFEYVEEIYFAGGEPLIMPEHYEILDKLLEIGKTDVRIRYSTNFSILTYKGKHIFDYWKNFPNLELFVSVDGIGNVGEYVRKGFNTKIFENNVKHFFESNIEYLNYGYIVTYSVLNFLHLFDMVIYLFEHNLFNINQFKKRTLIEFSPVTEPNYYSVTILPEHIKEEYNEKLIVFLNILDNMNIEKEIKEDLIKKLKMVYEFSKSKPHNIDEYQKFKMINNKLDQIREEDFNTLV